MQYSIKTEWEGMFPRKVGPNTFMNRRFTAILEFEEDHTVELEIAVEDGAPVCERVTIIRNPARPSLSGGELKRLPVGQWVQQICEQQAFRAEVEALPGGDWKMTPAEGEPEVAGPRRRTAITPAHLREVARIYRNSIESGTPARTVREHFHASERTASRWIGTARREGYLTEENDG